MNQTIYTYKPPSEDACKTETSLLYSFYKHVKVHSYLNISSTKLELKEEISNMSSDLHKQVLKEGKSSKRENVARSRWIFKIKHHLQTNHFFQFTHLILLSEQRSHSLWPYTCFYSFAFTSNHNNTFEPPAVEYHLIKFLVLPPYSSENRKTDLVEKQLMFWLQNDRLWWCFCTTVFWCQTSIQSRKNMETLCFVLQKRQKKKENSQINGGAFL